MTPQTAPFRTRNQTLSWAENSLMVGKWSTTYVGKLWEGASSAQSADAELYPQQR